MTRMAMDYSRITSRVYEPGCDYTSDWLDYVDIGFKLWRSSRISDSSMNKYSYTNMSNSFDKLVASIRESHPHLVAAMHLANLVTMVGSAGLKTWVDTGSGRYIQDILALLDDIPGPDVREAHSILETMLPYIDIEIDQIGEWVTSIERRQIDHCTDEIVFHKGQPRYETHCEKIEIDVEVCLIWDRLPDMTDQFNSLRSLIPEIGVYFIMNYKGWE